MVDDSQVEMLVENTATGKKHFIEGRWITAEETNRNGRMYPKAVIESALNKYHTDYISQKRAMGELGHPPNPGVNLDKVSHVIENLKMDGNYVTGRAKIMETPMGIIAKNLIDEGVKLGVSTRGLGSLKESNGVKIVQPDFFMSAIDIVSDPSGPGCFVNGIMESADYQMLEDGRIVQLAIEVAKKKINEEKALQEFNRLMKFFKG